MRAALLVLRNLVLQAAWILLATLICLEVVGLFVFDSRYAFHLRYLTLSQQAVVNQAVPFNGEETVFYKYRPNTTVRSLAVYADLLGANVEYDCSFETNALGFVAAGDLDRPADVVVLGDSFTEGQGGCPWLTAATLAADDALSAYNIFNAGLQSAGIQHFEKFLIYHESQITVKNVVLIAISNDFIRPDVTAWPLETPCYQKLDCDADDFWYFEPLSISATALEAQAMARRQDRGVDWEKELLRYSFANTLYDRWRAIVAPPQQTEAALKRTADRYTANLAALERIRARYPDLTLMLVPQRDELGLLGRKNAETMLLEQDLNGDTLRIKRCELTPADYMPIDGHPNRQGYAKIFDCLKAVILASGGEET